MKSENVSGKCVVSVARGEVSISGLFITFVPLISVNL